GNPDTSATEKALLVDPATIAADSIRKAEALLDAVAADGQSRNSTLAPPAGSVRFNDFGPAPGGVKATTLGQGYLVDDNSNGGMASVVRDRAMWSQSEQDFRLSQTLNQIPDGHVTIYLDHYFKALPFSTVDQIVNSLGKTIAHELGHNLGLVHTRGF